MIILIATISIIVFGYLMWRWSKLQDDIDKQHRNYMSNYQERCRQEFIERHSNFMAKLYGVNWKELYPFMILK